MTRAEAFRDRVSQWLVEHVRDGARIVVRRRERTDENGGEIVAPIFTRSTRPHRLELSRLILTAIVHDARRAPPSATYEVTVLGSPERLQVGLASHLL